MTNPIRFNDAGGDHVLLCPSCGGDCLHHERVSSYDRAEDADALLQTVVRGQHVSIQLIRNSVQNPSARRDGVAIEFSCEGCPAHVELLLAQHKGSTRCSWRLVGSEAKITPITGRYEHH